MVIVDHTYTCLFVEPSPDRPLLQRVTLAYADENLGMPTVVIDALPGMPAFVRGKKHRVTVEEIP